MTRTRHGRLKPAHALLAGAIALTGLLTGCAPGDDADPTATPAETTPAAPVETTPAVSETPPATPGARGADSPLEPIDAYALCRAQTGRFYDDPGRTEFAPFEDATVLLRDDGDWFVYMDVEDLTREPELVDAGGSECIVGGTIGEPEWELFGSVSREYADESIADYNRPPAQD
jgi:hypothetical protein